MLKKHRAIINAQNVIARVCRIEYAHHVAITKAEKQ